MYRTVLFDFDGTLTPSLELWLEAFQFALDACGRPLPEEQIIRRCFYRSYDDVAAEFGLASGPELRRHVHDGLTRAYASSRLFPGVEDLLADCRRAGLALGLVTSSPRLQVMAALDRLGLAAFFEAVVTGDDIVRFKPHPEPVERALRQMGRSPADALFVGDYEADVLAGRAAGTRTALFLPETHTRFYCFEILRAAGPDFVFADYAELRAHLHLAPEENR